MRTFGWFLCAAFLSALCACKYNKETVPIRQAPSDIRVPNQQRVIALATDQAVEALDFKALAGKSVAIELSGIFPHSYDDLLHYLRAQVEAKAARAGARVIAQEPVLVVPGAEAGTTVPGPATQGSLQLTEQPDYRVLVNVSWGGADVRDKVTTDEPLLTKQIGLGVGGFIAGMLLLEISDSAFRQTFAVSGTLLTVGWSVGWFFKHTPFPHVKTLIGRARIVAQGLPTKEGTAFTTEGAGESKLVNDERVPEGYMVVE
jgi:hypothetical protein